MRIFIFIFLLVSLFSCVSGLTLSIDIPEEYANVFPGEKVYFEVDVKYPENTFRQDLILEYKILDEDGKLVARLDNLKAIETQLSSMESIVVPESATVGLYYVNVRVRVGRSLSKEVSASFNVVSESIRWSVVFLWIVFLGMIIYFGFLLRGFWNRFLIRIKVKWIVRKRFRKRGLKNDL